VQQTMPFVPGIDADRNGFDVILPAEAGAHIIVSGTDVNDEFGNFNHFGNSLVDISAPGGQFPFVEAEITAVWGPCSSFSLIEAIDFCVLDAPFWVSVSGTIPATAEVSALAALIKSQHPDWTATQIRRQIYNTADDLGRPGKDEFFGRGRINLFRALTE
jgi:subtilisin family serine protease